MKFFRPWILFAFICLSRTAYASPQQAPPDPNPSQPPSATAAPAGAMTVYVSDFDLDVVHRESPPKPATRTSPPSRTRSASRSPSGVPRTTPSVPASGSATPQTPDSSGASTEDSPADQANALVNAVSENIIRALTQAGYNARRLPSSAALPQLGVRIRGVFAEADEQNRARRLLVGGEPVGPNLILYVGVNNLARPEQPLYALADPPAPDRRHGPVITVTSYAPAERFEVSRDPGEEELKKVAAKIAADFTALVNASRLSLTQ